MFQSTKQFITIWGVIPSAKRLHHELENPAFFRVNPLFLFSWCIFTHPHLTFFQLPRIFHIFRPRTVRVPWVPWVFPGSSGHARVDGLGHLGERAQRRIAAGQHGEPRGAPGPPGPPGPRIQGRGDLVFAQKRRGFLRFIGIYQDLMGISWENIGFI